MNVRIQKILKDKAKAQKAHRKKSAKRTGRKEANWEEKHRARFHKQARREGFVRFFEALYLSWISARI